MIVIMIDKSTLFKLINLHALDPYMGIWRWALVMLCPPVDPIPPNPRNIRQYFQGRIEADETDELRQLASTSKCKELTK